MEHSEPIKPPKKKRRRRVLILPPPFENLLARDISLFTCALEETPDHYRDTFGEEDPPPPELLVAQSMVKDGETFLLMDLTLDQLRKLCRKLGITNMHAATRFACRHAIADQQQFGTALQVVEGRFPVRRSKSICVDEKTANRTATVDGNVSDLNNHSDGDDSSCSSSGNSKKAFEEEIVRAMKELLPAIHQQLNASNALATAANEENKRNNIIRNRIEIAKALGDTEELKAIMKEMKPIHDELD